MASRYPVLKIRPTDVEAHRKISSRRLGSIEKKIQKIKFPPEYFPLPEAIEFELLSNNLAVAIGATVQPTTLQLTVPPRHRGIIRYFGNNTTDFDNTTWRIRINQGAAAGYGNITMQLGRIFDPTPIYILIPQQSLVDVSITNGGSFVNNISTRIKGWYWPLSAERELFEIESGGRTNLEGMT